jgi:prophage regulatory protein
MNTAAKQKILGFNDLAPRGIRFSRVHLSRLEKENKFPKRLNLGPQSIGWLESEVDLWIAARAAERSKGNEIDPHQSAEKRKSENGKLFPSETAEGGAR